MSTSHFRLLTSHRLEALADALARRLGELPLGPLERETIVVPSRGMARWVNLHLARAHGIAASVDFPFPFTWARRTVEALGVAPPREANDVRAPDGFDAISLQWRLHELLGRLDEVEATAADLAPLRAFLEHDPDHRKRGQLAARLATIFVGYQLQRPLELQSWERGRWFADAPDRAGGEAWQSTLWRTLVRSAKGERPLSSALLDAIEGLRAGRLDASAAGPRVEVFGVTTLPPALLALLDLLGRSIPVHLSFVSPTRAYWGDLRSRRVPIAVPGLSGTDLDPGAADDEYAIVGHPLLASWGRLARDFHHAVVSRLDDADLVEVPAPDPDDGRLLGALQRDLLEFVDPSTRAAPERPVIAATDRSLRVHLCHSELREMEVVREEIVRAFEDLPDLVPGEVLVLVPDLERYAPFARAVLGRPLSTGAHERRLPVRIADGGGALTESFGRLALELLRLADARLTATEVLDLFEIDVFARRFGLGPHDLPALRDLVREAGVRWGEDPHERARRLDLPVYDGASWSEGLDRLLLGFAMGDGEGLFEGLLPVGDATTARVGRIARLALAFDRLVECLRALREPRPLARWAADLREALLAASVAETEREVEERNGFAAVLESLAAIGAHFGLEGEVGRRTVMDALRAAIEDDAAGRGFVSGSITVAELRPMRSVPYRVIAVAGLGDEFPRRDPPPGFDLVARVPRRGDRGPRLDDRQLFLEILLSVRDRLVLTAVGRSVRDNTELARSVCLDELLEATDLGFDAEHGGTVSSSILVRHPLQPFDAAYFDGSDRELFGYDSTLAEAARALVIARVEGARVAKLIDVTAAHESSDEPRVRIDLDDLARFYRDPSAWFVRERLRMRTRREEGELDDEPFALDGLASWRLREHEFSRAQRSLPPESPQASVQRLGLVQGGLGRAIAALGSHHVRRILEQHELDPSAWEEIEVRLRTADHELSGRLRVCAGGGLLAATPSSIDARLRARTWVEHLAIACTVADGAEWTTRLLSLKDGSIEDWSFAVSDPRRALEELVRGYVVAHARPLSFFPATSEAWWKQWRQEHGDRSPLDATPDEWVAVFRREKVRSEWDQPSEWSGGPEAEKEAVKLCVRGLEVREIAAEEFVRCAQLVFGGIEGVVTKRNARGGNGAAKRKGRS